MTTSTSKSSLSIRRAALSDLPAITNVVQLGFPDDPDYSYRFPYRAQYPDDHYKWVSLEYKGYIEQGEKFVVLVATVPVLEEEGQKEIEKVVAVAVWDINAGVEATGCGINGGITTRRDGSPLRMTEAARAISTAFTRFFAPYGNNQIYLWLLTTDPDFRRRGAGKMLCEWGIEEAQKRGSDCMLTVIASPMGKALYERLGYNLVGTERVQVVEGEESFIQYCLEKKVDDEIEVKV